MTPSAVSSMELPWSKCVLGCEIPAEGRIHLLSCLHVLCSDACLEKETAGEGEPHHCKKCHRKFAIDQVRRNIKLEDFLKKKTKPEDVLKCGACMWNNPAASYCNQCKAYLCITCTEYHNRGNSNHQLEKNMNRRKSVEIQKQNQCRSHGDKMAVFYCLTCQVKMCEDCKPRHPSETHQVVTVEEEMTIIRTRIDTTKEVRGKANLAISKLGKKLESLKNAEWEEFVSGVDNLVTEAKEKLLDEGRKHREVKVKRIETKLKDLQDSSFLLQVNDISEKLDLDDTWMINVARSSLPQPKSNFSNISFTKEALEESFEDFVEENQNLVEVLPELQKSLFPQLIGSADEAAAGISSSSSPIPGPSSLIANHAEVSSDIPNEDVSLVRSIACKSTGGKFSGRTLGMPHITRVTSLASNNHANPPTPTQPFSRALEDLEDGDSDRGAEMTSSHETGSPSLSPISSMSVCSVPSLRSPSKAASKKGERGTKRKGCHDYGTDDVIVLEDSPKSTERRTSAKRTRRHHNQEQQNCDGSSSIVSDTPTGSRLRGGMTARNLASKRVMANRSVAPPKFLDAPADSFDKMAEKDKNGREWRWNYFPIQKHDKNDCSGHCCAVCVDGGKFLCCEGAGCNRVFHLKCCIPALEKVPKGRWRCNHDKPKEMIEYELRRMPDVPGSDDKPLTKDNAKQFALACYFMVAIHKIPERPTMQWYFPEEYLKKFKTVPYHLDFLRKKLCLPMTRGKQKPFSGVQEYMEAFKQMFIQAFRIYKRGNKYRKDAISFFEKFKQVLEDYYPEHRDLFEDILED